MSVLVTARDGSVTNANRNYAMEKGERLRRFFNGIQKLEFILGSEGQQKRAEIILTVSGTDPIATHAKHDELNAAIDLVIDRSEKRLLKHKEKIRNHRGPGEAPLTPSEEPEERLESYDEIIEKRDFPK